MFCTKYHHLHTTEMGNTIENTSLARNADSEIPYRRNCDKQPIVIRDASHIFEMNYVLRILAQAISLDANTSQKLYLNTYAGMLLNMIPPACNFNVRSENKDTWNLYHDKWIREATHKTKWHCHHKPLSWYYDVKNLENLEKKVMLNGRQLGLFNELISEDAGING